MPLRFDEHATTIWRARAAKAPPKLSSAPLICSSCEGGHLLAHPDIPATHLNANYDRLMIVAMIVVTFMMMMMVMICQEPRCLLGEPIECGEWRRD